MPEPQHDEALEEIWAARRRAWEQAGGTWEAYAEHLRRMDERFEREGGVVIRQPLVRADDPGDSAVVREDPPA